MPHLNGRGVQYFFVFQAVGQPPLCSNYNRTSAGGRFPTLKIPAHRQFSALASDYFEIEQILG
jgi:hypothetical protein